MGTSVIITTTPDRGTLPRAVASAVAQGDEIDEIVIVTDAEVSIPWSDTLNESDPEVRLIATGPGAPHGANRARMTGVRASKSKYVAFLDDDDAWLPGKIEAQRRLLEDGANVASCRTVVVNDGLDLRRVEPARLYSDDKSIGDYLFTRTSLFSGTRSMQTSTIMCQRIDVLACPFDENLKRHQDWDWLIRAERSLGGRIVMHRSALVEQFIDHGISISRRRDWRYSFEWAKSVRPFLTARAYSDLILITVGGNASSVAGLAVWRQIVGEVLRNGTVVTPAWLVFVGIVVVPDNVRRQVKWFVTGRRRFRSMRQDDGGAGR